MPQTPVGRLRHTAKENNSPMPKISWYDTRMVWPSLQLQLQLAPWHWAFIPRWYSDTTGIGWLFTLEWLFLHIQACANDKPFELMRVPEPKTDW